LVPAISLYLATDVTSLWQASEEFLAVHNISPPFWAFAWPGSEALARYITDHPQTVAGLRVLDFAAGGGLAAIACARAGAAQVDAAEIDPLARCAISLNAAVNQVAITTLTHDVVGLANEWDVILCGDIFYEARMTNHILPWLRACAERGQVLIADPGRAYVPRTGKAEIARMTVPTSRALETGTSREVTLFSLLPDPRP
jgi:predicted nicotinamide N-methyase